ncbi:hypothetical protein [Streptomyces sp. NPDC003697]
MIQQVMHETTGTIVTTDPARVALSPSVTDELPRPATRTPDAARSPETARTPEVAVPELMGLRTSAVRHHRHKVPLRRLTAVRG